MYTWIRHAARLTEARGRQQEHLPPEEGSRRLGDRWGGKDAIKAEPSGQTIGVNQGHKRQGPQELSVLPQLCQDSRPTFTLHVTLYSFQCPSTRMISSDSPQTQGGGQVRNHHLQSTDEELGCGPRCCTAGMGCEQGDGLRTWWKMPKVPAHGCFLEAAMTAVMLASQRRLMALFMNCPNFTLSPAHLFPIT